MDVSASVPALLKLSALLGLLLLIYFVALWAFRLYWSPLAAFPGPRLAALSNWYEFYYDVILQGKFTFHIQDLHKQYGMIWLSNFHPPLNIRD